jgi:hypothetical protein
MGVLAAGLRAPAEDGSVAFGKLGNREPIYQVTYAGRSFVFNGGTHHPYSLPKGSKTSSQFNENEFDPSNMGKDHWSYEEICRSSDEDMPEGAPDEFEQRLWDRLMRLSLPVSGEQDPQRTKRRMEEYRRQSRDRAFTRRLLSKQSKPNHCAVCDITILECLQGAHVIEVKHGGDDITTNGIILCGSHHLMFDQQLFGIDPETQAIVIGEGYDRKQMRITFEFINEPTGVEELKHRWKKFEKAEQRRKFVQ